MGIKPPGFYCAFGTREKLFLETPQFYADTYWSHILREFSREPDARAAFSGLFENAVKTNARPNLPKEGCFVHVSTVGLGSGEAGIGEMLAAMDRRSLDTFRKRLMRAIDDGQIHPDSDVHAISGAIMSFMKGIAIMSRTDIQPGRACGNRVPETASAAHKSCNLSINAK